ncbi:hypothetical protein CVD25_00920 [Bacillus canaveralius]|uniref:Uncharacterized protein n=1 Tax=Bacillus canaveralius TaxID=1403243 RepID=A0A2N5GPJ8_9BACI|nr:hypothetical protein [Bacillus canaveralius]PLR84629.1 hypothetical protein CU635_06025 [Bacillus canaveralius]PLS00781.1 hypothetical protein CVD25_00920 [Bacillus canaveralius]
MTTGEMLSYTQRFNRIVSSPATQESKDISLSIMMSDLEQTYQIPALQNEKFERQHPTVMQLYRTVSEERSL